MTNSMAVNLIQAAKRLMADHHRRRRAIFVAACLFALLFAWWACYLPYDRARLYRAIPSGTMYVSEHGELAGRWDDFSGNPLARNLLTAIGVKESEIDDALNNALLRTIVGKFASRNTVLGYVPALGPAREPAWVMSSWAGTSAQFVRWGFYSAALKDFEKRRTAGGDVYWVMDMNSEFPGSKLSLAVCEGLLLGAFSADADSVAYLIDRVRTGAPILPELQAQLESGGAPENDVLVMGTGEDSGLAAVEREVLDRGWLSWISSGRNGIPDLRKLRYEAVLNDDRGFSGRVKGIPGIFPAELVDGWKGRMAGASDLEAVLGDAADTVVVMPYALADRLTEEILSPGQMDMARCISGFLARDKGLMFLAVLNDGYTGRLLGLKVPTVLIGARSSEALQALGRIPAAVDTLNARYGLTMISRKYPEAAESATNAVSGAPASNGVQFVVVSDTRSGIYGSMREEEKPAFTAVGNWLILGSNLDSLRKLVSEKAGSGRQGGGRWVGGLAARTAPVFAWVDMASVEQALKNALAVYSLVLMVQESGGNKGTRETIDYARALVDRAGDLRDCFVWLDSAENGELALEFLVSGADPVPKTDQKP